MKKILYIILASIFLYSCQSTKDGFTLKKKSSADEFLVEKKSPLVVPPDYGKLPLPGNQKIENENEEEKIKIIINNQSKSTSTNQSSSIEESILEKIK